MNINQNTLIQGLDKTGLSREQVAHYLSVRKLHEITKYTYYGKHVRKGTVRIYTENGKHFDATFRVADCWVSNLNFM